MTAFRITIRALAILALVTGSIDVLLGLAAQATIGAALEEGYGDPLLNSQIRYLGAVWLGFGALLWHGLGDLPKHSAILRGALTIVFVGGLGRVAAVLQLGPKGIRVNAIAPGPIADTEGMKRLAPTPAAEQAWTDSVPLRRWSTKQEIAKVVQWLCSDDASYISGVILPVDGGWSLGGSSAMARAVIA